MFSVKGASRRRLCGGRIKAIGTEQVRYCQGTAARKPRFSAGFELSEAPSGNAELILA